MKLNQVLSNVNQVERSKFITCLDRHCSDAVANNKKLSKTIDNIDGQIKKAHTLPVQTGKEIAP